MEGTLYKVNTAMCPPQYQRVSSVPDDLSRLRSFVVFELHRPDGSREIVARGAAA